MARLLLPRSHALLNAVVVTLASFLLPPLELSAQQTRFRYSLFEDSTLPADVRRTIDSMNLADDKVHKCPSRGDTLWVTNRRRPIPAHWLRASLRFGCGFASLPLPVRRRLRDDPASLSYYEAVFWSPSASPDERAAALQLLSWSAEPEYFPLLLHAASEQLPARLPRGDYNASYYAVIALAPYLSFSVEARRLVTRAFFDPWSAIAREAGVLSLAAANDISSRQILRTMRSGWVDEYTRNRAGHVLTHAPCSRGLILVVPGYPTPQDYCKCELPPDYR